ncbi:hypothetical protein GCM10011410_30540 [Hoyosella rhizosphaerae]|uniref:Carboxypeptidase regulatory-like domain-containing protein n=2 Tax=Hoyosella rhizosphaerae TaxID=1755582 RepID=A0A916XJK7_9ACTN|nr:hypothetical protein GCM10011410_30540 [Hoyosella rhizosphaerae]
MQSSRKYLAAAVLSIAALVGSACENTQQTPFDEVGQTATTDADSDGDATTSTSASDASATPLEPPATGSGTFNFAVQTTSGSSVPSAVIAVARLDHCDSEEPGRPLNPRLVGKTTTDSDGAAAIDVPPGCYGFSLIEVPRGTQQQSEMHRGEITEPGQRSDVRLTFYDGTSPTANADTPGTLVLLEHDSQRPIVGASIVLGRCGGGGPGFNSEPTDAAGRVDVVIPDGCFEILGMAHGNSPCSLVGHEGQQLRLPAEFTLTLLASSPDPGVC